MVLTPLLVLKLALVPTAVWLASVAARRWGHAASGYLGGLPLIGGPITLFLAIDLGSDFAARSALVTLAAVAGQAAHLLTFSLAGRAAGPIMGLLSGWAAYAAVSSGAGAIPLVPLGALAFAVGGLAAAWHFLPRPRGPATLPSVPRFELWLRLGAALALAAVILFGASALGPTVSGILLSMPVTGSIMPPFTLRLYGADSLARLLRGFITGLTGFTTFFFIVTLAVVPLGIVPAFSLAALGALAMVAFVSGRARTHR